MSDTPDFMLTNRDWMAKYYPLAKADRRGSDWVVTYNGRDLSFPVASSAKAWKYARIAMAG